MVESVRGETPPPRELVLDWWCEKYHSLPAGGGLFEQDYFLMMRMSTLSSIHNTYARLRNMQGKQIHSLSESDRRILRTLRDMGLLYG